MNKTLLALIISSTGIMSQANSTTLVPISARPDNSAVAFKFSTQNTLQLDSGTFISNEPVNMQVTIDVKKENIGQQGSLFLVVKYNESWYQFTSTGQWTSWNPENSELLPFNTKILDSSENISIVNKQALPAGEFLVYSGYQTKLGQQLYYNSAPSSFVVFDKDTTALHKVKNKQLLTELFTRGSQQKNNYIASTASDFSPAPSQGSTVLSTDTAAESSTSQTNLQELGVDESDRIKTDGNNLFTLEQCKSDPNKECINAYQISSNPATNTRLGQLGDDINLGNQGSLYLADIKGTKHLIHQGNSNNFASASGWFSPFYWQNNKTELRFIDISKPSQMSASTYISLDAAIVSSRLVDGILYLVTRKNPNFEISVLTDLPTVADDTSPAPKPSKDPVVYKEPDIADLLPRISFSEDSEGELVVNATDCFIPSKNSNKLSDNTLITITAIPLDNPKSHYSTCIAGNIDTFYMSTKSLYLASSQYPNTLSGNSIFYQPGDFEMSTEIHKFALTKNALEYRGSGIVEGHLGWEANKQSFRMGEHDDVLKIATSKGNVWDESSTTSVSVFRESADGQNLEEISSLHNLGKPGEKLYAARFIGSRGYLVTFKKVDPLYVLDFKNPEQPKVLGELEINGYSDYLHPIGENYLLGIGKDAITEQGNEFAWYQGVKLSLFDVSDGQNLREIKSVIIGKRGTESAILQDHHALAWLPSDTENSATLAIPIQLNDRASSRFNQNANAHNDWTHTGLYTFNISTDSAPDIELLGKLITDQPPEICNEPGNYCYFQGQQTYNDRAVIQDDSVHYIHNNEVFSSTIADLE